MMLTSSHSNLGQIFLLFFLFPCLLFRCNHSWIDSPKHIHSLFTLPDTHGYTHSSCTNIQSFMYTLTYVHPPWTCTHIFMLTITNTLTSTLTYSP